MIYIVPTSAKNQSVKTLSLYASKRRKLQTNRPFSQCIKKNMHINEP